MKLITKQQQEEAAKTTMIGMLKGGILGLGLAIPTLHFASKRFATIRAIPPVQRGWLLLISTLGVGMTNAELSYEAYLKSQWHGRTADILRKEQEEEEAGIQALSPQGRALHWAKDNRFGIIGMSWVTAMAISGGLIFARNRGVPFTQKIVQVRMYAQGVTIAVLLASAGLSAIRLPDEQALEQNEKLRAPGEAWKLMIDNNPSNAQRGPYVPPSHHHDTAHQSS
ncbi:hypoxia induced motif protein [Rhizoctonia solani AG-3 Rhs1AP]|uniref:Hypoxia induced motif protein n=2 Tax=Rhizoctonia solani AG-3 TaxID=1086053 RepID=A0A074S2G3_9AGAM|nr:hypoxia induced motif protein [Rhizoctonia solani AG-3 Rhs1AP]KEP53444.1 hypoxia induced motif protein [Rhizoctonia solani 123E]